MQPSDEKKDPSDVKEDPRITKLRARSPGRFAYPMQKNSTDPQIEVSVTGRVYYRDPKTGTLRRRK